MAFQQPAAPTNGDSFSLKEHPEWVGALALVYPAHVNPPKQWNDRYEPCETVTADIILLDRQDATGQPIKLEDSMVFPRVMVAQLKANLKTGSADPVLGRISKRPTPKGDAWEFGNFAPQDAQVAESYISANPRNGVQQPAAPAADPWAVPAAAVNPPAAGWNVTPPPAPAPAPAGLDPKLVAFLASNGIDAKGMAPQQAEMIARTFQG